MRAFTVIGAYLLTLTGATALDDNRPETWLSPNRKYGIKETFYGEGKLVRGIFVHAPTGNSTTIYLGGARTLSALWSPDSHYVALTADRTKYRCEVKLFRVEHGEITEIALPPNMNASKYLSADAREHLGHLSFEGMNAKRWLSNTQIEIVSETEANFLDGNRSEVVSQHFIVEISRGEARIVKTYAEKGA
jgi:hypothetical protein